MIFPAMTTTTNSSLRKSLMPCSRFSHVLPLLLLAALLGCRHDPNVQKQKYFESGQRYFDNGKYREAVIQFSNALQVDSRFVDAHYQLAQSHIKLQEWNQAYEQLEKTVELRPDHYRAHIDLANLLVASHSLDRAKEHLDLLATKDAADPAWKDDSKMKAWNAFMDKYLPDADRQDQGYISSYMATQTLVEVLRKCGDDLTRENVMHQAANLRDFEVDVLLPGIKVNTGPKDFFPVEQMQMRRFTGQTWELFGPIIDGEIGS